MTIKPRAVRVISWRHGRYRLAWRSVLPRGVALLLALATLLPVTAVFSAITPLKAARIHLSLEAAGQGRGRITYWANGFTPGETVAVSWGASDKGSAAADRYGNVGGAFTVAAPLAAGPHGLALYGLSSHRILTDILTTGARARRRAHIRPTKPPLYLGLLPGPVATVTPPVLRQTIRVPLAAGALPVPPLAALSGLLIARRRKRHLSARRTSVRRPARR